MKAVSGVAGMPPVINAAVCDGLVSVKIDAPAGAPAQAMDALAANARGATEAAGGAGALRSFTAEFVDQHGAVVHRWGDGAPPPAQPRGHEPIPGLRQPTPQTSAGPLPGVRHVAAVGAGKGGVGKSTIALNLAVGLARRGHAVGLLDADIYGPSMPTMLGLESHEPIVRRGMLQPFYVHGVKAMTMGKLVEPGKPLIWRGPMAHGAFKQLAEQTDWGELDYLIIDLPPGTGDISLTMAQLLQLTGAVVVCTPQRVAQDDAERAAKMFQQLGVAVLGVVENMSAFIGDDGKTYEIFGKGGAETMAQRLSVPFLGAVPITMSLRVNSDKGDPTSNFEGRDEPGKRLVASLESMVTQFEAQVALAGMKAGERPKLTIS